jgi:hypothetical protein
MKGEILMLVPETAGNIRATIGAMGLLDGSVGVSFHNFFLPDNNCVRLLLQNSAKRVPEAEIQ